jgi:hypothetical protein
MNTMRVFPHDLLWQQDAAGFRRRFDAFLRIADKDGIKPMFVLSIPAGTLFRSPESSGRRSPACTIPDGCRARARRLCRIRRGTRACRPMWKA